MGDDDGSVVVLTCTDEPGAAAATRPPPSDVRRVTVPGRPTRTDVDPLLADPDLRRLVVAGTDADLAAVLVRLLRTNRLDVELAYVPADRRSAAARVWGLPHGAAALELARRGVARPAPLVRDDTGGVLVGRAEVRGVGRGALRGEAYCDGELVLRGAARRLVVAPWPDALPIDTDPGATGRPGSGPTGSAPTGPPRAASGPAASPHTTSRPTGPGPTGPAGPGPTAPTIGTPAPPAVAVRAGRTGTLPDGRAQPVPPDAHAGRGTGVGRAVQLGCLPATVVLDGVEHPRAVTRWAWYRHVADWLLVRPDR